MALITLVVLLPPPPLDEDNDQHAPPSSAPVSTFIFTLFHSEAAHWFVAVVCLKQLPEQQHLENNKPAPLLIELYNSLAKGAARGAAPFVAWLNSASRQDR